MKRLSYILSLITLMSVNAYADSTGENQANSFTKIYTLCLKHINNLDELRKILKPLPTLPPDKAKFFLSGNDGDAWPVPDKHGNFVLTLLKGKDFCSVVGRRADTEITKKQFMRIVSTAPTPLTSKQVRNEDIKTGPNGLTHTVAYEWSIPNAPRKMLFTLTTAPSDSAQLQVLGSAAIISQ